MEQDKIVVVDFGAQYSQLIAKTVRKCQVFSEIRECELDIGELVSDKNVKGVILSGGPKSVYQKGAPRVDPAIFETGIPVLGICYGMQFTNFSLGGGMLRKGGEITGEYGEKEVLVDQSHVLFLGLEERIIALMSHGDSVDGEKLASGLRTIARTESHVAAFANDESRIYGVQFHPEVTHTPKGRNIIDNFVHRICGCRSDWTMENYIEESKRYIQETAGDDDVLCFVSGGVDSTYSAALLAQTDIPGRKHLVYIDALMRKEETEEVVSALENAGIEDLVVVRATKRFLSAVKGMSDPEDKRKAIGNLFGQIMTEVCHDLGIDASRTYLMQGTLYTDLIESGKGVGKKAANIKSHHNVGCRFIEDLRSAGKIVEPNRLIFKDEVRELAREIGLPPEIYLRQPFPGPGGGIRIVDSHPTNEVFYGIENKVLPLAKAKGYDAFLLPVKTVGVQGDERSYAYAVMLRGPRDWEAVRKLASDIPDKVPEINRVVYFIGGYDKRIDVKGIETKVNEETLGLWQDIEDDGKKVLQECGYYNGISQAIFVEAGADLYNTGERMAVLRLVKTDDFMTVDPAVPNGKDLSWDCLDTLAERMVENNPISAVAYDITDKPPATTCWE